MRQLKYIFLFTALLSLASCAKDDITGGGAGETPADGKTVVFTLSNSAPASKATRAISDPTANEKVINRLDVFFFDETGNIPLFHPANSQLSLGDEQVTISVPQNIYDVLLETPFRVYILANCYIDRSELDNKTLDEIKQLEIDNAEAGGGDATATRNFNLAAAPKDFIMSGETLGEDGEPATVEIGGDGNDQILGNITLRRAAAKVVVNISNANVAGYTPGNVTVRISNYLDATTLDAAHPYDVQDGDYKTAERALTASGDVNNSYSMPANALYTYSNDWSDNVGRETYITIEVEWIKQEDMSRQTYYYRIPFSYINAKDPEAHRNRIVRNYVYEFMVNVSELGGLDPEDAVVLGANFDIMDWSTEEIAVSIHDYHYLFVYNPVVASSEAEHTWEFRSSIDTNIRYAEGQDGYWFDDATDMEVWCIVYTNENGTVNTEGREIKYAPDDPEYPTWERILDENLQRTYVKISSTIPENYVPLHIKMTLRNRANLSTVIEYTILPKEFVTVTRSTGGLTNTAQNPYENPNYNFPEAGAYVHPYLYYTESGGTTQNLGGRNLTVAPYGGNYANAQNLTDPNYNFYEVNLTSVMDQDIVIGGGARLPIMIGDPTVVITEAPFSGTLNNTANNPADWQNIGPEYRITDVNMQNVVSPNFIMASRRGAVGNLSWANAVERCKRYRESQYPAGTWRVPTFAELAMIMKMQYDDNSAIKGLLANNATVWWTAQDRYKITVNYNNYTGYSGTGSNNGVESGTGTVPVRCVRDTWRDYPQDHYGVYGEYRDNPNN